MTNKMKTTQEELTVSSTKKIWVKPTVEIISVESGVTFGLPEGAATPATRGIWHS